MPVARAGRLQRGRPTERSAQSRAMSGLDLRDGAPTTLNHAGIAARIPHAGRMCVLDRLLRWNETELVCSASSHRDPANPLRSATGLLAPVLIEYAAQAMALHGGLLSPPGADATPGY